MWTQRPAWARLWPQASPSLVEKQKVKFSPTLSSVPLRHRPRDVITTSIQSTSPLHAVEWQGYDSTRRHICGAPSPRQTHRNKMISGQNSNDHQTARDQRYQVTCPHSWLIPFLIGVLYSIFLQEVLVLIFLEGGGKMIGGGCSIHVRSRWVF